MKLVRVVNALQTVTECEAFLSCLLNTKVISPIQAIRWRRGTTPNVGEVYRAVFEVGGQVLLQSGDDIYVVRSGGVEPVICKVVDGKQTYTLKSDLLLKLYEKGLLGDEDLLYWQIGLEPAEGDIYSVAYDDGKLAVIKSNKSCYVVATEGIEYL